MNGNTDKCEDCLYFSYREHVPESEWKSRPFDPPDGYCRKIFPRGYVGAGKPGGNVFHGKMRCFQFEKKEDVGDQLKIGDDDGTD